MADIRADIGGDWASLNTLTGIPIGTQIKVQNKGTQWLILQENVVKPDIGDFTGEQVTTLREEEPSKVIINGSGEIWIRTASPIFSGVWIFVQEV